MASISNVPSHTYSNVGSVQRVTVFRTLEGVCRPVQAHKLLSHRQHHTRGCAEVHKTAAFVQELELPIELDELEGRSGAEPAARELLVPVNGRRRQLPIREGCKRLRLHQVWTVRCHKGVPLLFGEVVELIKTMLSLRLPHHRGCPLSERKLLI